jgi:AraC family transcriptional regulator of adaptative response/methylated-DNA-[protein]-cysteine methyltransferase
MISSESIDNMLKTGRTALLNNETGCENSNLPVHIELMPPAEYNNGGKGLYINYSNADSPFGEVFIASTAKGVCYLAFAGVDRALGELRKLFPNAHYTRNQDPIQQNALLAFSEDRDNLPSVIIHLKATPFQLKVWKALLKVSAGKLVTYGDIAASIGNPKANRAVGTAVGANPVSFLIPCHRVIRSTGDIGQYHWGSELKMSMINWER